MLARSRWVTAARWLLVVLVLAGVLWALAGSWDQVRADLTKVSVGAIVGAGALCLLALALTLVGWRALLSDLGSPLGWGPASGVLFVGQLGKYVPGSLWAVLVQAEAGAAIGVPRGRTAVVGLLSVLLSAVSGLGMGLLALPAVLATGGNHVTLVVGAVLVLLPLGAVLLHPRVLNRLVAWGLRRSRRPALQRPLSGRAVAVAVGSFAGAWGCLGLHLWVLAHDLGAPAASTLVPTIFGYALAASVAMVAVVLPAGVGLRELVLVLLLTGPLERPAATAVVLLSRFLVTAADVLAAAAACLYDRRHRLLS